VKVAGITKPLRVRGLNRIPEGAEVSCARLLKKPSGYYLHVVYWLNKEEIPHSGASATPAEAQAAMQSARRFRRTLRKKLGL